MRKLIFTLVATIATTLPAVSGELLMFREDGCIWCARWDHEIAAIYPKTPEGRSAPVRMLDLHSARPADITLTMPVVFSPTFVLVDDAGNETGRIEGYPGEDFFWGLLGKLLNESNGWKDDPQQTEEMGS